MGQVLVKRKRKRRRRMTMREAEAEVRIKEAWQSHQVDVAQKEGKEEEEGWGAHR